SYTLHCRCPSPFFILIRPLPRPTLFPYTTLFRSSQREERLDVLDARMDQFGLDREHYAWYRDFRRYGTVPHAGFGLGFERLIVYVCGVSNIRDATPYPLAPGVAEDSGP